MLSEWLYTQGAIEEEDRELYEYGVYVLLINISPILLSLLIGSMMGLIVNGVLFITPFILIRKFSGGLHTRTVENCFILSVVTMSSGIYLTKHFVPNYLLNVCMMVSVCTIIGTSPIDSENRHLEDMEKKIYRRIASCLAIIFSIIYVGLYIAGKEKFAVCISLGTILVAGLQALYLVQKFFMSVKVVFKRRILIDMNQK